MTADGPRAMPSRQSCPPGFAMVVSLVFARERNPQRTQSRMQRPCHTTQHLPSLCRPWVQAFNYSKCQLVVMDVMCRATRSQISTTARCGMLLWLFDMFMETIQVLEGSYDYSCSGCMAEIYGDFFLDTVRAGYWTEICNGVSRCLRRRGPGGSCTRRTPGRWCSRTPLASGT